MPAEKRKRSAGSSISGPSVKPSGKPSNGPPKTSKTSSFSKKPFPVRKSGVPNKKLNDAPRKFGNNTRAKPAAGDKPKTGANDASVVTPPSTLRKHDELADFPRGGGSVLTPLEYKEVANEAARDVLFEYAQAGNAPKKAKTEKKQLTESGTSKQDRIRRKQIRNQQSSQRAEQAAANGVPKIKIDGLTFKNLVPGTLVLGQVSKISAYDVSLSLPDCLTGYIPITNVSEKVSDKLDAIQDDDEGDDESTTSENKKDLDDDIPDLKSLFKVGQWLCAVVTEHSASTKSGKSKSHIELSVKPSQVNAAVDKSDLTKGVSLQCSISSVEDHGAILDVGFEGLSGFISNKELEHINVKSEAFREGQPLLLTILNNTSNSRTLTMTATAFQKNVPALSVLQNVDSLVPGTTVDFTVSQATAGGLAGKVAGLIDATIDFFHCACYDGTDLPAKYKDGQHLKARVVSYFPAADVRKVRLSLLPHVLSLGLPVATSVKADAGDTASSVPAATNLDSLLSLGTVLPAAKILFVEPGLGVFIDTGIDSIPGFAHISRLSDTRIEEISPLFGEYKLGTIHAARITGYSSADGLFLLSLQPKVVGQKYLHFEDVKVGDIIDEAEVVRIVESGGLLVSISDGILGHANELHLSDVKISQPERRFRPGMHVKCRVLSINPERKRIRLTLKKSLINADNSAVVKSYDEAKQGQTGVSGSILNIVSNGAIVEFFGGVTAFLPLSEMSNAKITSPSEKFSKGQSVKVRIIRVNAEFRKMRVSAKDPKVSAEERLKKNERKANKTKKMKKAVVEDEGAVDNANTADAGEMEIDGAAVEAVEDSNDEEENIALEGSSSDDDENDGSEDTAEDANDEYEDEEEGGLSVNGFNWNVSMLDEDTVADADNSDADSAHSRVGNDDSDNDDSDAESDARTRKRRRKRGAAVQLDITGNLATKEPESVADFERMLLGSPNSSTLWIRYMAFQVQLGEIEKARGVAQRALKTINFREEKEKLNIWVALLNLENNFGTPETLEEIFKEACVYMDPEVMKTKLKAIQKKRVGRS
ncbi:uncharacterized protein V1518DRAFT_409980 [Limtongia smithiae]|uniref:uncharacterized protein n=1 Tax=Limtongia smithiae TaxID=1125753 RepID=UPI0034CD01DC